jgi:hypothetical protein
LDVKVDIVRDASVRNHLERLALEIGVSRHARFLGFLGPDDVARVISSISVFVDPSILSPVVAYDVETNSEYTKDGVKREEHNNGDCSPRWNL